MFQLPLFEALLHAATPASVMIFCRCVGVLQRI
jgi:hypothetical protein